MKTLPIPISTIQSHFTARAAHYNQSSHWCTDRELLDRAFFLLSPLPSHRLLDVAVGTGLVAARFRGAVAWIVGLDVNTAMFEQARPYVDELVLAPAEKMPFADASFDLVTCRQGLQFMDARAAIAEMIRVLVPGGRILLLDLCAWCAEDREEYFEILRLRNPARRNFWERGDVELLLREAGLSDVRTYEYVSIEDVDVWSDNKAIDEERREAIREVYRHASPAFLARHRVSMEGGRIVDQMLFTLTLGVK